LNDRTEEVAMKQRKAGWILWWSSLAVWTVLALADAVDYYVSWRTYGHHASIWRALLVSFPGWEVWALLAPVVFWLGRRVPLHWPPKLKPAALHLGFSIVIGVIHATIHATFGWLFSVEPTSLSMLQYYGTTILDWCPISILMYWAILAVRWGFDSFHRFQEEQVRAADLAHRLTEARLEALAVQLHPHFLFNTLNAAVALVRTNDSRAAKVLTQLGDILRHLLRSAPAQEISLKEELAFLERYLEIEQIRFSNRLSVSNHIPEKLLDAMVPNLILQPLVENAIRHGLGSHDRAGHIELTASATDGVLHLVVRDDGPGLPTGWSLDGSTGVGLANIRSRLDHLFGGAAVLDLRPRSTGGVEATITLPLRRPAQPTPAAVS
jgi:two-component system LytT family sensor kinase